MSDLWPGGRLVSASGHQFLLCERIDASTAPLVLFLPGGSHLARIAYGHPSGVPDDGWSR
ncbi:hypothetical protein [Mesorhizobium sp. B4-1-4]|uniref:hypothetical protein n=1 Tax=Mesorhizobium sp. B4-1-4 TaxID=2589888 RepID=UPI00112A8FDA|nr:hypothetical protein [Mesorhizobium sp. B4-1-4]UCI32041.1 hypothetical protein FJW03_00820 [Mesorhizobium sp. B4-1-4]